MGAEVLLYGYGLVCISMLVFNLLYMVHLHTDDRRRVHRTDWFRRQAASQLETIRSGGQASARHLQMLRRRLARVSHLLAFDRLLDELDGRDPAVRQYIQQFEPVCLDLARAYLRRENTQAAYFCHFLYRHQLQRFMPAEQIQQLLLSYLQKDSLYCRVNALKALCTFGNPSVVTDALLRLQNRDEGQIREKLVTETLCSYTGDSDALIAQLLQSFDRFSLHVQRAILDYIRFTSGNYCDQMLALLEDDSRNKELHFPAIRYLGRYPYEPARALLLRLARDDDPVRWEYAAVSAAALAGYTGQDVQEALVQALQSPNWYVRYNASASLERQGLSYESLLGRLRADDRYAREMLIYRLEQRRLEQQAQAANAQPARREAAPV